MSSDEVRHVMAVRDAAAQLAADAQSILRRRNLRTCDSARIIEARKLIKAAHRDLLFCFVDAATPPFTVDDVLP